MGVSMGERGDADATAGGDAPGAPAAVTPVADGGAVTGERAGAVDGANPTVIHVDDDPAMGPLVAAFLDKADGEISVVTETDPEAALERVAVGGVDCLVTDVEMPKMNGCDLAAAAAEAAPALPVVLFTSREVCRTGDDDLVAHVSSHVMKGGEEQLERLADAVVAAVD